MSVLDDPVEAHSPGRLNDLDNIRISRPADDDSIADLLIDAFSNLYAAMGTQMSPDRERYLKGQADRRHFAKTFVYEVDQRIVATVTLVPPCVQSEAWIDGAWDLRLLAVDAGVQGRGVARSLLKYAEEHASLAGATAMCLHTRRGVRSQSQLYLSCGYLRDPKGDLETDPVQDGYRKPL